MPKKNHKKQQQQHNVAVDDRFDSSKPQFRKSKQQSNKIVLDDRFSSVLSDSRFQLDIRDKYGRRKSKSKKGEELNEFYTIDKNNEEKRANNDNEKLPENKEDDDDASASSSSSSSSSKESSKAPKTLQDNDPSSRIAYLTALSRGELDLSSSSSSDDDGDNASNSSDSDDGSEIFIDPTVGTVGVLDPSYNKQDDEPLTFDSSPYMAICNMDWDHVKATDVFAIVSSFAPPGSVRKVSVYPSDFGLERMALEEQMGPQDLWEQQKVVESVEKHNHDSKEQSEDDSDVASNEDEELSGNEIDDIDPENIVKEQQGENSGFDPEKLRAYEASKLKYYFAVVEFANPQAADAAYNQVDGTELEHSSAALDMRLIPVDQIAQVTAQRSCRDEATTVPGNYVPPEFVVSALQQTSVNCTWEEGDLERERKLTKYGNGESWHAMAEEDDLKAYIASDNSSDSDNSDDSDPVKNKKASKLRQLLGLGSDDDSDRASDEDGAKQVKATGRKPDLDSDTDDDDGSKQEIVKEFTYTPGETKLEDKIRSKLQARNEKEKTPWEKYLEKKKEKRREKKRAAREKREAVGEIRRGEREETTDDFFLSKDGDAASGSDADDTNIDKKLSQGELELLVAGDDQDELARNYDMRGLQRIEKNKSKKLKGSRQRKEEKLAKTVTGTEFEVNVQDNRFSALLDGTDDRFGIDRTDPNFKETPAMKKILSEQTKRRKAKRRKIGDNSTQTEEQSALKKLVQNIKAKVK